MNVNTMKNKFTRRSLIKIIVILAVISMIYSIINTKTFDLQFAVDKQTSDDDIESIFLKGTVIKFPFNFCYIKGTIDIGEKKYILTNYEKTGTNGTLRINTYKLQFVDNDNSDFFWGEAKIIGDIVHGSPKNLHIEISETDKQVGYTQGETINSYLVD